MAELSRVPGFVGYKAYRESSLDGRTIGKFTDVNHLSALHMKEPAAYDKEIISIYTQSSIYSNDFLQMLDKSTPFMVDSPTWQWKIGVPYSYPRIVAIPASCEPLLQVPNEYPDFLFYLEHSIDTSRIHRYLLDVLAYP